MWSTGQARIIQSDPQNQIVFAAPGSGKTTVLTEHIASVIEQGRVAPAQIVALTFTKQAATELKHRLLSKGKLTRRQVETVQVGTFHSQIFRWLLQSTPDIPVILRDTEQRKMISEAQKAIGLQPSVDEFQRILSLYKSQWPTPTLTGEMRRVWDAYERLKRRQNRWDFDDILSACCQSIERGLLPFSRSKYILVDEFQDTNQVQWVILQAVARHFGCSVFVVGDDDQSIYGFRGASPLWFIRFRETMPSVTEHFLDINYRSDTAIVSAAVRLITHNSVRISKRIETHSTSPGQVRVLQHANERRQAEFIFKSATAAMRQGQTVGVLARTRAQLMRTHRAFIEHSINEAGHPVEFRTFHDAKGKEWDEVHIVDAVDHSPYLVSHVDTNRVVEEERRLFYVAMTRAKRRLWIHVSQNLLGRQTIVSKFVKETGVSPQKSQN